MTQPDQPERDGRARSTLGPANKKNHKQLTSTSFRASAGDKKLLAEIQETLGCGLSEAIRTAIRVYAALLKK